MTKSNKINILQADHVVGLSQASIEINIGLEILLLAGRALPSINLTPTGNPKFQNSQISILTADLESAEKTVNCQSFLQNWNLSVLKFWISYRGKENRR